MGLSIKTLYKYQSQWTKGQVPSGRRGKGKVTTTEKKYIAIEGETTAMKVKIDNRLYLLYNWDIATTGWKGSFDQWITDCIMGYHIDYKDELQLEKSFAEVK